MSADLIRMYEKSRIEIHSASVFGKGTREYYEYIKNELKRLEEHEKWLERMKKSEKKIYAEDTLMQICEKLDQKRKNTVVKINELIEIHEYLDKLRKINRFLAAYYKHQMQKSSCDNNQTMQTSTFGD